MSEFEEYQRRRFMRENAHLYIRHDVSRLMPPGSPVYVGEDVVKYFWPEAGRRQKAEQAPDPADAMSEAELLEYRRELAKLRLDLELFKVALKARKYSPNQPRVPAGNPDGGQWTSEGASGGSDRVRLASTDKPILGPRALAKIAFELIKIYRSDRGLLDLFGNKVGAVTYTNFKGEEVFGSNSTSPTYQRIDRIEADRLRTQYLEENPESGESGRMPANAFYHAETTILLRTARRNGGTLAGETFEVFGDRILCNNCEKILPFVGRRFGNPTVTFFDTAGEAGTIRDGVFHKAPGR